MNTGNEVFDAARTSAQNITGPVLAGMLIGGLVGAVVAMLFAPSSGEETRVAMRQKAIELQDRTTKTARDTASQATSKVDELTRTAKNTVSEAEYRAQGFKESARNKAVGKKEHGKELTSEKLERKIAGY